MVVEASAVKGFSRKRYHNLQPEDSGPQTNRLQSHSLYSNKVDSTPTRSSKVNRLHLYKMFQHGQNAWLARLNYGRDYSCTPSP